MRDKGTACDKALLSRNLSNYNLCLVYVDISATAAAFLRTISVHYSMSL